MKKQVLILLLAVIFTFNMCKKKDDPITATDPPTIEFISDDIGYQNDNIISGAPGKKMTVRAELKDDVGISSFRITYPEWQLDNTVNVAAYYPDQALNSYIMEYSFLIPSDADESKTHEMEYVVTNLGNLSSESQIIVTMDGDYEAPVIFNEFPGNNSTVPPEDLRLRFEVTDNVSLDYVVIEIPAFNYYDSITSFEDPKHFSFDKKINVQDWETYKYYIRASDKFGNQNSINVTFHVGIPTITHMFLVDKSTQAELDRYLIGTTLRMETTETDNEHTIVYYCAEEGTPLRFMENFSSFSSSNFLYGVDGETLVENAMDSPYVLNAKGYYWITINTELLTFEITGPVAPDALTDARTIPTEPWLYGRGVDGNFGGWDTYSDYMTIDTDNKYLFHLDTKLGDAENDGYCEGCIGIELNGNTEWDDEYIWEDILWFGYHWFQDGVIDEVDENGGKPEGWAGLAGQLETWSDDEENYWNVWTDMSVTYHVTQDMYTRQTRIYIK